MTGLPKPGAEESYGSAAAAAWQHLGVAAADGAWALTSVEVFYDDFAIARADRWSLTETRFLSLLKERGSWRIVGEASAADRGNRGDIATAADEIAKILAAMDVYYRAVRDGDAALLDAVFQPQWLMWNHRRDGSVVSEDKATFMKRVGGAPLPAYADDRHVAEVLLVGTQLARVRIDKPSSAGVTVFILARAGSRWMIGEKAWSNGVGE